MSGKEIDLDINGQPSKGYLALPSQLNAPGVLVLHAWWGLNPTFKGLCDRLAAEGFAALAPDLREGRIAPTIDAVLSKAMAKRPEDRFSCGAEMAIALRNCARYS